jgi:hypothetical protein
VPPKDALPVKPEDSAEKKQDGLSVAGEKSEIASWAPRKKVLENGNLFVEVGWKGFGPQLPPLNAGGFGVFRMKKIAEKGTYENIPQEENLLKDDEILIDINDPRNNQTVEKIKEVRNNYLRSLLRNDMRMPLHDIESLRHEVIKIRYLDKIKDQQENIPLLESEVAKNPKYQSLLVKHYTATNQMVRERGGNSDEPVFMDRITKVEAPPRSEKTSERIYNTKMNMLKRQNVIKLQKNQGISDCMNIDQVVKEFRFVDAENKFLIALKELLQPRRRLKKTLNPVKKIEASRISKIVVSVQVIKGTHIPARTMNLVVDKPFSNTNDERANVRDLTMRNKSDMNRPTIPEARRALEKVEKSWLGGRRNYTDKIEHLRLCRVRSSRWRSLAPMRSRLRKPTFSMELTQSGMRTWL